MRVKLEFTLLLQPFQLKQTGNIKLHHFQHIEHCQKVSVKTNSTQNILAIAIFLVASLQVVESKATTDNAIRLGKKSQLTLISEISLICFLASMVFLINSLPTLISFDSNELQKLSTKSDCNSLHKSMLILYYLQ